MIPHSLRKVSSHKLHGSNRHDQCSGVNLFDRITEGLGEFAEFADQVRRSRNDEVSIEPKRTPKLQFDAIETPLFLSARLSK